jgi:predicted  nucleic acid-binding Zn-ribbon protein
MSRLTVSVSEEDEQYVREQSQDSEEYNSLSGVMRDCIQAHKEQPELEDEIERLRDRLESRESRIEDLEEQLARRSQIEEKVEEVRMEVKGQQEADVDEDAPFPIRWWRWWQRRQE